MDFHITHGLAERHRRRAAEIYAGAFERYFATSPLARKHLIEILAVAIDPEMAFAAIDRNERLLGLVGMQIGRRHFVELGLPQLRARFGLWRGLLIMTSSAT